MENKDFIIENGVLTKYNGFGGDVTIPAGVTSIGNSAFWGCEGLTSVTIPAGVTKIGLYAFADCTGLTSVTIPASVTEIGPRTFQNCTGLTSVTIPAGVTSIGDGAFYDCTGLASVTILADITKIHKSVFKSSRPAIIAPRIPVSGFDTADKPGACAGFAKLYLEGVELDEEIKAGYLKYIKGQKKRLYPTAIQHEELLQLMLAEKMLAREDIDPLLEECDRQNNVSAKAAVLEYAGKSLKPVDLAAQAEKEFTLLEQLAETGVYPVAEAKKVFKYKKNGAGTICITALRDKDTAAFIFPKKIGKTPVTEIGQSAFCGCKSLTSVTIPEGVKEIGQSAFSGCTSLTSVTIPAGVTTIGNSAFKGCHKLADAQGMVVFRGILFDYTGPSGDVTIPAGVTEIGQSAFYGCTGLTSVTIPAGVTEIGQSAFSGCTGLTSVTIPADVTEIGEGAFSGCTSLTSVTIPAGVTEIGWYAFSGCTGLTSVTIPEGVTVIGERAFRGCTGLTSVTIPESVTEIGYNVFTNCRRLVIHAPARSYAEQYAKKNSVKFEML